MVGFKENRPFHDSYSTEGKMTDQNYQPRKAEPKPTFAVDYIRDISEKVYRDQLGADDTARMIEKDNDGGQKLRNRAASYDHLTRSYLKTLGFTP